MAHEQLRTQDLVALLKRYSPEPLEQLVQRLQQTDLLALARFPAQPHVLIHQSISSLHTVLLSLSTAHDSVARGVLQLTPWPLLRLDLLANLPPIWRKMWKRLSKLRRPPSLSNPRRKPLAIAQVQFVCHYLLVPALATTGARANHGREEPMPTWHELLSSFGRVSSIAESVAAYVLLCVHYSLIPPAQVVAAATTLGGLYASSLSPPKLPSLSTHKPSIRTIMSSVAQATDTDTTGTKRATQSWRCGLKLHGRFFLFRASVSGSAQAASSSPSLYDYGRWSTLALDCRHAAVQWRQTIVGPSYHCPSGDLDVQYARTWARRGAMPASMVALLLTLGPPGRSTFSSLSLVFQAAVQMELFTAPRLGLRQPVTLATSDWAASSLRFSLHVVEFTSPSSSADHAVRLTSIGLVEILDATVTLADLRVKLVAWRVSTSSEELPHLPLPFFQFYMHGRLVAMDEEPWHRALDLVPVAFVCRSHSHNRRKLMWRPWLSMVSDLHETLTQPLCTHLHPPALPQPQQHGVARLDGSMFPMDQLITDTRSTDVLLTTLLDWSAFVRFQQLQDTTTILYEHGSPHKRKPRRPPMPLAAEEDARLRPEPTPEELELLALPHGRFRCDLEYLRPLYATLFVTSRTQATLESPCLNEVEAVLSDACDATPVRIATENDECVLHITSVTRVSSPACLVLHFKRDASCPLEMLRTLRQAYVWLITKLPKRQRQPVPPRWLRDVHRFVVHPTLDFTSSDSFCWPFASRFFHVGVPLAAIEQHVEATFWSRSIDWHTMHWRTCDVERELVRKCFEALCHAFPESFSAIDSVKFSKFLRECGLQPAHLTVGDAAFVFTTFRAHGSHYEMIYDGFLAALRWIASRIYSSQQHGHPNEELRLLCFDWLLRARTMHETWRRLVDTWRRHEKLRYMETAAIQYCAAARIQANWRRLVTRRVLINVLTRLKTERRAAATLQSVYKMRRQRAIFQRLRFVVVQTQRFVRARRQLRRLRLEKAQLVEKMRQRLQRWMRQRLRVLRCWKWINAVWLARRQRIRDKQSRLVCMGAFQIESRLYRAGLYRRRATQTDETVEYELEVVDPRTSCARSIVVTHEMLELLESLELTDKPRPTQLAAQCGNRWRFLVLIQHLYLKTHRAVAHTSVTPRESVLQIYRDPLDTSLGRLVFQGAVRNHQSSPCRCTNWLCVRVLLRAHELTLIVYAPHSCHKQRFSFRTAFAYRVLQVTHWHGLTLALRDDDDDHNGNDTVMLRHSFVVAALTTDADRLEALRAVVVYVMRHGTTRPTYDMQPDVIAQREAERHAQEELVQRHTRQRELALVVQTQANARRLFAIRRVQKRALALYTKSYDRKVGAIVYRYCRDGEWTRYATKPRSLRDCDVPDPPDEWVLSSDGDRYFNPLRGVFSRVNDQQAAVKLQRWFRNAVATCGLPVFDLRMVTQSLLVHRHVRAPHDLGRIDELDHTTHFALQRHALHHDYKAALGLYEAALLLAPRHGPALIGLAVLLIVSCRYPSKQTWIRALELLEMARHPAVPSAIVDEIEQHFFRWALFLEPKNPHTIANLAVFLQCVRGDLDRAELLYRRAIDLDPSSEEIIENYLRLQRERTPEGIYSAAGPSAISIQRAQHVALVNSGDWQEMRDIRARIPSAEAFFRHTQTGKCVWTVPVPAHDEELPVST